MKPGFKELLYYGAHSLFLSAKGFAVNAIKYNREFYRILEKLEQSQWYSQQELQELQDSKIRHLITHAYEHVPYYNRLFKKHSLKPGDIKGAADLPKIPLLSKKALREAPQDFIATNINRKML